MSICKHLFPTKPMASAKIFTLLALVAISAPLAMATDFIVGDDKGWTLNFDYQAWALGKKFIVGDRLIFKYAYGAHNVLRVDGVGFQKCSAPANTTALTSGYDVITLATPGRKWYICGVAKHCEAAYMKLFITVLPMATYPYPSPPPPPPAPVPSVKPREFIVGDGHGWTLYFDYQAWALGKDFRVGDKLIFRYPKGAHNVYKVDGVGFQQCMAAVNSEALTSGEDVVTLATPGRKWYICGVGKHCAAGNMKLAITVAPTPTYAPPTKPYGRRNRFA